MRILICPVAIINAPLAKVLDLLELQHWEKWINGTMLDVSPPGKMVVGQEATLYAKAFLLTWKVKVKVVAIDKEHQNIRYDVFDPLGFRNEEKLEYKSLSGDKCEVHYNCNFIFQDNFKGWIVRILLMKKLIDVPKDSIQRLKTTAEKEYKRSL